MIEQDPDNWLFQFPTRKIFDSSSQFCGSPMPTCLYSTTFRRTLVPPLRTSWIAGEKSRETTARGLSEVEWWSRKHRRIGTKVGFFHQCVASMLETFTCVRLKWIHRHRKMKEQMCVLLQYPHSWRNSHFVIPSTPVLEDGTRTAKVNRAKSLRFPKRDSSWAQPASCGFYFERINNGRSSYCTK